MQAHLNVRRELTDSRTRAISLARAITRGAGLRIRSGSTGSFLVRVAALDVPSAIAETLAPLQRVIAVLNDELATADDRLARIAAQHRIVARLTTVPGIGPITATAYVAALDDAARFGRAAQKQAGRREGARRDRCRRNGEVVRTSCRLPHLNS